MAFVKNLFKRKEDIFPLMSVLVTYNTLTFDKDSTAFVKEYASVIIALREETALAVILLIIPPIPSTEK